MRRGRLLLPLLAGLVAVGGCAAARPFVSPDLAPNRPGLALEQEGKLIELDSGLRALVLPVEGTNLVRVDVRYRTGAADDPASRGGLAHVVEHMTFEGRRVKGGPTLQDELTARSLAINAYTSRDETHYWATALAGELEPILELEARRMATSCDQLDLATFERERQVVLNERLQRGVSPFEAALHRSWYGEGHPYERPLIGTRDELEAVTLDDVCRFIDDHYSPRNAIVVITGAVQIPTAELVLKENFGNMGRPTPLPRRAIPAVAFKGQVDSKSIAIDEPVAVVAFPAPVATDRESVFTDLLAFFLAREMAAAFRELDYVSGFAITRAGGSRAPVYAAIIETESPDDLDKAVDSFFERRGELLKEVFDGFVFSRAQAGRAASLLQTAEPLGGRSMMYANLAQYARHNGFLAQVVSDLQSVTSADLALRSEDFFAREKTRITRFTPSGEAAVAHARSPVVQRAIEYDIPSWGAAVTVGDARRAATMPAAYERPAVARFTLDNGLDVLLVPDLSFPLVEMRLVFDAGETDDPAGAPGTAFFAGSLLQHDWGRRYLRKDIEEFRQVMRMGGQSSVDVGETYTVFSMSGLSRYADGLLWQLFWKVYSGEFDGDVLDGIQDLLRELESDMKDNLEGTSTGARLTRALFGPSHPYVSANASMNTLQGLSVSDLEGFRNRHYGAEGATLVVVGKFDVLDMRRRVERLYSRLPNGTAVDGASARVNIPGPLEKPRRVVVEDDDRSQARLAIAFATANDERAAVRAVMVELVRIRMSSLRRKLGSTYGTSVTFRAQRGPGMLSIVADVAPDRYAQTLNLALQSLRDLHSGKGIEADFVRARREVLGELLARQSDSTSVANELALAAGADAPLDFYERVAKLIAAVTVDDVRDLLRDELAIERAAVVGQGDQAVIEQGFEAAGLEPATSGRAVSDSGQAPSGP